MYIMYVVRLTKSSRNQSETLEEVWQRYTALTYKCRPITTLLVFPAILSDSLYNNYDVRQSVADPFN